jgi:hypothetical protein
MYCYFVRDPNNGEIVYVGVNRLADYVMGHFVPSVVEGLSRQFPFYAWIKDQKDVDWTFHVGVSPKFDTMLEAQIARRTMIRQHLPQFSPDCPLLDQVELLYAEDEGTERYWND